MTTHTTAFPPPDDVTRTEWSLPCAGPGSLASLWPDSLEDMVISLAAKRHNTGPIRGFATANFSASTSLAVADAAHFQLGGSSVGCSSRPHLLDDRVGGVGCVGAPLARMDDDRARGSPLASCAAVDVLPPRRKSSPALRPVLERLDDDRLCGAHQATHTAAWPTSQLPPSQRHFAEPRIDDALQLSRKPLCGVSQYRSETAALRALLSPPASRTTTVSHWEARTTTTYVAHREVTERYCDVTEQYADVTERYGDVSERYNNVTERYWHHGGRYDGGARSYREASPPGWPDNSSRRCGDGDADLGGTAPHVFLDLRTSRPRDVTQEEDPLPFPQRQPPRKRPFPPKWERGTAIADLLCDVAWPCEKDAMRRAARDAADRAQQHRSGWDSFVGDSTLHRSCANERSAAAVNDLDDTMPASCQPEIVQLGRRRLPQLVLQHLRHRGGARGERNVGHGAGGTWGGRDVVPSIHSAWEPDMRYTCPAGQPGEQDNAATRPQSNRWRRLAEGWESTLTRRCGRDDDGALLNYGSLGWREVEARRCSGAGQLGSPTTLQYTSQYTSYYTSRRRQQQQQQAVAEDRATGSVAEEEVIDLCESSESEAPGRSYSRHGEVGVAEQEEVDQQQEAGGDERSVAYTVGGRGQTHSAAAFMGNRSSRGGAAAGGTNAWNALARALQQQDDSEVDRMGSSSRGGSPPLSAEAGPSLAAGDDEARTGRAASRSRKRSLRPAPQPSHKAPRHQALSPSVHMSPCKLRSRTGKAKGAAAAAARTAGAGGRRRASRRRQAGGRSSAHQPAVHPAGQAFVPRIGSYADFRRLVDRVVRQVARIKHEQHLVDVYTADAHKSASARKVVLTTALQRSREALAAAREAIRRCVQLCDEPPGATPIPAELYDDDGELDADHILCCACPWKRQKSTDDNDIILCDGQCSFAYHELCLDPPVKAEALPPDEGWLCPACYAKVEIMEVLSDDLDLDLDVWTSWREIFPTPPGDLLQPSGGDSADGAPPVSAPGNSSNSNAPPGNCPANERGGWDRQHRQDGGEEAVVETVETGDGRSTRPHRRVRACATAAAPAAPANAAAGVVVVARLGSILAGEMPSDEDDDDDFEVGSQEEWEVEGSDGDQGASGALSSEEGEEVEEEEGHRIKDDDGGGESGGAYAAAWRFAGDDAPHDAACARTMLRCNSAGGWAASGVGNRQAWAAARGDGAGGGADGVAGGRWRVTRRRSVVGAGGVEFTAGDGDSDGQHPCCAARADGDQRAEEGCVDDGVQERVCGKRRRGAVDYVRLHAEMFGAPRGVGQPQSA